MKTLTIGLIKELLPDNPIVVEAGAHIGRDTVKMIRMWPNSTIYAFEPVPSLFAQLKANVKPYPNVIPLNYALSSENQKRQCLYVSSGRSTALSSLLKPIGGLATHPNTHWEQEQIDTLSLSNIAQQLGISHIDYLRLDTQGTELAICKGAGQYIDTVKLIMIEVNLVPRYQDAPYREEVEPWLTEQGFHCIAESPQVHGKTNILYVRNMPKRNST